MLQTKINSTEYKKILENMPICCVDVVICHCNKILLVYRNNEPAKNEWWFPGGRVYKNERLEEAAVRKTSEEVGIKVQIIKMIGIYETMFDKGPFDDLKSGVHTINIYFLVKPTLENFKIKIDDTSSDYRWIDKIEENLHPYVKKVLKNLRFFV
ncbi:MAG: NUDIX domain-containing protein [Candidatus Methanoperedens sp.]|nr:NUDIX domain-containing protein [Candidatus Methanoperedens sp. BLZ2]KAB2948045.1 MAG: NUDIX domain-containing protein [Candidatus Methanoperedens sp.]MBZ0174592.1 NUDIX domain-containing protein [Candidatus Methanoperedens nitroreducens]MCX9076948.1 NUDIX domain-containing protein [Candidatus Methanoperedens sp.]MCX9086711.1 NUDIX domain-containing protein [Candidatus Methanoperedens sp.]